MASTVTIVAIAIQSGCAQDHAKYLHPVAPPSAEARTHLDPLSLEVAPLSKSASVPSVPPATGMSTGQALGQAALAGLPVLALPAGCLGEVLCTIAVGAVSVSTYVVAVPVMTIMAVTMGPPTAEEVSAAREGLRSVLSSADWDEALRRDFAAALRESGGPTLGHAGAPSALRLTIEGPWLVTDQFTAVPTLTVHGELSTDDVCVADRRWRWNGDSDDFVDFGDEHGAPYRKAMEKGIELLSAAIVEDLFLDKKPRKTAYWDDKEFKNGAVPRMAALPLSYQNAIGSWDKTDAEAAGEPRCGDLAQSVVPQQHR
ncbi:MAG: hypothetical protein ACREEP_15170 [Dongiaceae bacterium]